MEDRTYNVRISTEKIVNPFDLDLRGCGQLHIVPGREYFFENAPINFINYVVQLAMMNITYRLTDDKNGCYYTVDLTDYNKMDPNYIMSKIRKMENPIIKEPVKKEKPSKVVLSSDDLVPREDIKIDEAEKELNNLIAKDLAKEETPIPETIPEIVEENNEVIEEIKAEDLPKYTDSELSKLGKVKLLEIASLLGLENISDINTKKEIREAIIAKQEK